MAGKNIGDLLNAARHHLGRVHGRVRSAPSNANGTTGCKRSTHSPIVGTDVADYIPHHNWFQYYRLDRQSQRMPRPSSLAAIGYSLEHDGTTPTPPTMNMT